MKLPRLLIPVVVFLAAGAAVAVAVFSGDKPALVDTSGIAAASVSYTHLRAHETVLDIV